MENQNDPSGAGISPTMCRGVRDAKNLRPDRTTLPEIHEKELERIISDFDMRSLTFDADGIKKGRH